MQRVNRSTAVAQLPAAPAGGKPGYFAKPDVIGGTNATVPGFEWYNAIQEELAGIIEGAGLTLDGTKFTQAFQSIRRIAQKSVVLADTGAVNALAAANSPAFSKASDLADGLVQQVRIAATNNGASTYSPDGIGGDPILGLGLQPLQGGELIAGGVAILFRMTIPAVNAGKPFWLLMECAGGAQQVAPATQPLHAVNLGQMNTVLAGMWSSYRNLLVNGAMRVAQQYGNALQSAVANGTYVIDQWRYGATQAGKFNFQQVPGPTALGFDTYAQFTVASAYTPGSSDSFTYGQNIEAQTLAALAWGTPNAKPISLQFVVNASIAGTYGGVIGNGTRSYAFTFSIPVANVDTPIAIPNIPGDTGGTWMLTGTSTGAFVTFDLGAGTANRTTAGTWQTGVFVGVTGAVSLVATAGATFKITGAQPELGTFCTPFERPTPEAETVRCQRYLPGITSSVIADVLLGGMVYTSVQANYLFRFSTPSRVPVTGLVSSPATSFGVQIPNGAVAPSAISLSSSGSTTARIAASVSGLTPGQASELYATVAGAKLLLTGAQL